jgi:predicted nucleotidyltransferase
MITSTWGFGSFFRGERHQDIDVLLVGAVSEDPLLDTARELRAALLKVEHRIGIPIDPLILAEAEFEGRPLRDMGELVRIGVSD